MQSTQIALHCTATAVRCLVIAVGRNLTRYDSKHYKWGKAFLERVKYEKRDE